MSVWEIIGGVVGFYVFGVIVGKYLKWNRKHQGK